MPETPKTTVHQERWSEYTRMVLEVPSANKTVSCEIPIDGDVSDQEYHECLDSLIAELRKEMAAIKP